MWASQTQWLRKEPEPREIWRVYFHYTEPGLLGLRRGIKSLSYKFGVCEGSSQTYPWDGLEMEKLILKYTSFSALLNMACDAHDLQGDKKLQQIRNKQTKNIYSVKICSLPAVNRALSVIAGRFLTWPGIGRTHQQPPDEEIPVLVLTTIWENIQDIESFKTLLVWLFFLWYFPVTVYQRKQTWSCLATLTSLHMAKSFQP